ncbi:membrane protein insertion efficiency factor [Caldimicrobium thiodismutans]|jgi:putative membrane protein insertion efficiency factor|uniref:Putative membrane protein insertion efficiency factor n=1 Tax=Caldimicrobium thiodismutans TaxID=1653476 RepID=A0A0U4N4F4_9BACT|nr:membrane protein insertion efficiency factor YidD [Caldimicrobium thiodismutans]BAU24166.1 membrane protein insertion efficiency factor [Caldimicrobium thiodismutans]
MLKKLLLKAIEVYQWGISPFFSIHLGIHCRYYPSCSEYTKIVISEWGILKGSWFALKRFLRCNPLFKGGVDFPPRKNFQKEF